MIIKIQDFIHNFLSILSNFHMHYCQLSNEEQFFILVDLKTQEVKI
jgi:hypothetical protein